MEERPLLTKIDGKTAHFKDGSTKDVDAIILCTGYLHHFPFLNDELKLRTHNRMHPPHIYKGVVWEDNPKLFYIGMQDQFYTFNMFDAQAWYARDVIMGRIKLPSKAEMAEGRAEVGRARGDAGGRPRRSTSRPTIHDLCEATDYPNFDIDMTVNEFMEWEHHKGRIHHGLPQQRLQVAVTGTMAPMHHTPWLEAHGRYDEDVSLGQEGRRGIGVARGAKGPPLRAHPHLLRIVMREAHDPGGQPLLLAVELADFDHGADVAMGDIDAGKRDRLLQDWRASGARDYTDLRAADMDAVTVPDRLLAIHLKPDEFFLRVRMPFDERIPADEIVVLRVERHGEADSGLERVGLVAEFVTGEDETRLDAQHVEGLKTEWLQPMRLPRLPDRVEHRSASLGWQKIS